MNDSKSQDIIFSCRKNWEKNGNLKWKYSFYAALIFFIISGPEAYNVTQSLLGNFVQTSINGCPTSWGLTIHSVVFAIIMYIMMSLPKDM